MGFRDLLSNIFKRSSDALPSTISADLSPRYGVSASELGKRSTPESEWRALNRELYVDPDLRQAILDIRELDRIDGRVKKIHSRTARSASKSGLRLQAPSQLTRLHREFNTWLYRLQLHKREKLESDLRGFLMEGNLILQWVYDANIMVGAIRMPAETIVPITLGNGRFKDPFKAYKQIDLILGAEIACWPLYQMGRARLAPDNYDDMGCLGRPYLDASRAVWKRLNMTEQDMVVRRRMRAPLRMVHTLEGASKIDMDAYRAEVEQDQSHGVYRDYYLNKKGSVASVQGDANLDQIADVVHLLDTFFAGMPAPKGLFGYPGDIARDVLDDLKRDYFDELDSLQDNTAQLYQDGFELHLLMQGMNPDNFDFKVVFAERMTDTANQRADHALKLQALGASLETCLEIAGLDTKTELEKITAERTARQAEGLVYPDPAQAGPMLEDADEDDNPATPAIKITPGNGRKGDSATTISTRTGNR